MAKTRKGTKDSGSDTPTIRDDRTAAVRQAGLERDDAEAGDETVVSTREIPVELQGAADQFGDLVGDTTGDAGGTAEDDVAAAKEQAAGGGEGDEEEDDDPWSRENRRGSGDRFDEDLGSGSTYEAGGGGGSSSTYGGGGGASSTYGGGGGGDGSSTSGGGGDLGGREPPPGWGNPLAGSWKGDTGDPLTGFLDTVDDKTGRDETRAGGESSIDEKMAGRSVADGERTYSSGGGKWVHEVTKTEGNLVTTTRTEYGGGKIVETAEVVNTKTGERAYINEDGSATVIDASGKVTNVPPPPKPDAGGGAKQPAEEYETDPETAEMIRKAEEELHAKKDPTDDGHTDPSEVEPLPLGGSGLTESDVRDMAVRHFGQPAPGEDFTADTTAAGGDHGYYNRSQGAGSMNPTDDQNMSGGPQLVEDTTVPGRDPIAEPPAGDTEETDESGDSGMLPPTEFRRADTPDALTDAHIDPD